MPSNRRMEELYPYFKGKNSNLRLMNTRMKYSGADFKLTSQANHLSKLQSLLNECHRQSHHMQRLYKRRKIIDNGEYRSNWSVLREKSTFD